MEAKKTYRLQWGSSRKDQIQFTSNVDDEEPAHGCRHGEPKVTAGYYQRDEAAEVFAECVQEFQLVKRRDARNEYTRESTSRCSGSLHDVVPSCIKAPAENGKVSRKRFCQRLENEKSNDSSEGTGSDSPA